MELKNKQIIIETTNVCQAHCVSCPREKFTQQPKIMDLDLFKKIIDDASQYNLESLDSCGFGDCFLDNKLFERFQYVREKMPKCDIFMSTTGYNMNESTWENMKNYVDILKLSIFGVTKETYEASHRGKITFYKSISNIMGFLNYAYDDAPYTIGLFLQTEQNKHEKDLWIEKWKPLLNEIFVWTPHNWVDGREYRKVDETRRVSCGRPMNAPLYIHADGTVSPCCFDLNKRLVMGDIKTQSIEQIYKGEAYEKLREAHLKKDFTGYICQMCDQTNYNPEVLIYKSNKDRQVGQITSNQSDVRK